MTYASFVKYLSAAAIAVTFAAPANAEPSKAMAEPSKKVSLYGAEVVLPAPEGFCWLRQDVPADAQILQLMSRVNTGRNMVLAMFAPCKGLRAFRAEGAPLKESGAYMAPVSAVKQRVKMPRARFTKMMAGFFKDHAMKAEIEKAQNEAKRRLNNADAGGTLDKNENLGLLHHDDEGAYIGAIQTMRVEGRPRTRVATVLAMTIAGQKAINVSLTGDYKGQASVNGLLARQRQNIRRVIAAN